MDAAERKRCAEKSLCNRCRKLGYRSYEKDKCIMGALPSTTTTKPVNNSSIEINATDYVANNAYALKANASA